MVELTASFLFSCSGYYRYDHGYLPDFEGMDDFAGTIVHPQAWPEDLDVAGKRIVVIGSGATAVTLRARAGPVRRPRHHAAALADLHRLAAREEPGRGAAAQGPARQAGRGRRQVVPRPHDAGLLPGEPAVPEAGPAHAAQGSGAPAAARLRHRHPLHAALRPLGPALLRRARTATSSRRSAPGTASVVTDHIERFTEQGLLLTSGDEIEADIIVTATGLELLFLGGIALSVDGEAVDPATRLTYKGMMLEGVPNMAVAIGYTNASWTLKCDLTCDYVCRLLNHMRERGLTECVARNRGRVRRARARSSD